LLGGEGCDAQGEVPDHRLFVLAGAVTDDGECEFGEQGEGVGACGIVGKSVGERLGAVEVAVLTGGRVACRPAAAPCPVSCHGGEIAYADVCIFHPSCM
jgi:hypothetical protein